MMVKMPKTGPSPKIWLKRLTEYAQGSFQFERGQRPGKTPTGRNDFRQLSAAPSIKILGTKMPLNVPLLVLVGFMDLEDQLSRYKLQVLFEKK